MLPRAPKRYTDDPQMAPRTHRGSQPIVHLGSEGDEIYVLAPTTIDFLRLLAVGYGELGSAEFASPPSEEDEPDNINPAFQNWVSDTFDVAIPVNGADIVGPADSKHRKFQSWIDDRCE